MSTLRIGISSCLAGNPVRHNSNHCGNHKFVKALRSYGAEFVAVCPEVEIGLPTPRKQMRLVGGVIGRIRDIEDWGKVYDKTVNLVVRETGEDLTSRMQTYARAKVASLKQMNLDGYILKSKSPSCGINGIKLYQSQKSHGANGSGPGMYARVLIDEWPTLPIEEEGRLNDINIRAHFIIRILCHNAFRNITRKNYKNLKEFHNKNKYVMMAHCEDVMPQLDKLLSKHKNSENIEELYEKYYQQFFQGIKKRATRSSTRKSLVHLIDYLKKNVDVDDRDEMIQLVEEYHNGEVPFTIPSTLITHHLRKAAKKSPPAIVYRHEVLLQTHPLQRTVLML
mmetsp:Transcript_3670/g.4069  ORF Transcript_3670/g.4069 Transcript_3670/m.4069 type:complete len:337 (+) Transcript_3670:136-1146(+)